jgi:hypothetical protein
LEDCKIKLNGWMAEIGRTGRLRVGIFERVGELRALGLKRRWKARRLKTTNRVALQQVVQRSRVNNVGRMLQLSYLVLLKIFLASWWWSM